MSRSKKDIELDLDVCDAKRIEIESFRALLLEELIGCDECKKLKLCNVTRGTIVSVEEDPNVDELLRFDHIDGMVVHCYDIQGMIVYMTPLHEVYTWGFGEEVREK